MLMNEPPNEVDHCEEHDEHYTVHPVEFTFLVVSIVGSSYRS